VGFGPLDEDILAWPAEKRAAIKALPTSLEEALCALEVDHDFLLEGDVFSADLMSVGSATSAGGSSGARSPHPYEIEMYYDL
jgi:glutamine synthetase